MRWCNGFAAAAQVVVCVGLVLALAVQHQLDTARNEPIELTLWWMAPFYSSGGYCSEAVAFALSLQDRMSMRISQHGDAVSHAFVRGLPDDVHKRLRALERTPSYPASSIVVCHSEPGAWAPPLYQTTLCPPPGTLYRVGRTMFETDRLTAGHVERCNAMDEIWVPSAFHIETFSRSGVDPAKLHVVPESVDVAFFNPAEIEPLELPDVGSDDFCFLSVFKWEYRKGWDVLLKAYFSEFDADEQVVLVLKTAPYHPTRTLQEEIDALLASDGAPHDNRALPRFLVMASHVNERDMARLYRAADAFVLPSRGEGWGRPHVEAMSMELPVIATNWSGSTAFLHDDVSYPLPIDGLETIEKGPFRGHQWARPSVAELRRLMRHVYENRDEAKAKGRRARRLMVEHYNPAAVADIVEERMRDIQRTLRARGSLPKPAAARTAA